MNTPYRKHYDDRGLVSNPITKHSPFINHEPNRRRRRSDARPPRFKGNHRGVALTVVGTSAYFRVIQRIGNKSILHYVQKTK